jgi:hypothetical protein
MQWTHPGMLTLAARWSGENYTQQQQQPHSSSRYVLQLFGDAHVHCEHYTHVSKCSSTTWSADLSNCTVQTNMACLFHWIYPGWPACLQQLGPHHPPGAFPHRPLTVLAPFTVTTT